MFFLRKLLLLVLSVQLLSFAIPAFAATEATPLAFNNKITGNVRWTKQNSPYLIRQTLSIPQGSSLTIDPGVVVKFDENAGSIFSQGTIYVGEVLSEKVIFTSILDDTRGGVTRLPSQTEAPKETGSIKGGISLWSGQSTLTNADFFYFSPFTTNKTIAIQSGTHSLSNLSFQYGKTAIVQAGGSATVTDSTFDNDHYGIEATGGHTTFRNNTFHNKGINLRGNALFTDEGNNQGTGTIFLEGSNTEVPFVLQTNLRGGQMPYRAHRLSVPLGADISFEKGLTLMVSHSLSVQGRLTLEGTAEDPLTITSSQDEQGVDRNKDGLTASGTPGQWKGVSVSGGTLNGTYAHLKYGGSGGTGLIETFLDTAQVNLTNSTLSDSSFYLIRGLSGNIHVTNSTLTRSPIGATSSAGGTTAIEIHNSSFLRPLPSAVIHQGTGTGVKTIDATNNYWDHVNGPELNTTSPQDPQKLKVSQRVNYAPFLTRSPICEQSCHSSVAFLPGIMGSRLYENGEEIWFSASDQKQEKLSMNPDGTSKYDVYTIPQTHFVPNLFGLNQKQPGIINDPLRFNLYHSFLRDIAEWHEEGLFFDYAFLPYDWRLSLEDIVMNGKVQNGKLSYTEENTDLSQSYLYQQIKKLEEESYTGKVTLIGHSNGGLVIKAFIQKLKEYNDPLYHKIDQVILVAVPQVGTPDATVSMLFGSGIGSGFIVSTERARDLARNMPSMYSLLPSKSFFPEVSPQISFQGVPSIWTEEYGNTINTHEEFQDFLRAKEGREEAGYEETNKPQILRESLLTQAEETHRALDNWQPSQNTKVTTLAGTGLFTARFIETQKYTSCLPWRDGGIVKCKDPKEGYTQTIKLTLDGDETVLEQSALHGVGEEWWVDLESYSNPLLLRLGRVHKDILEIPDLRSFIKSKIQGISSIYQYVSQEKPTYQNQKYTRYEVHSPVYLTVTDSQGNVTGYNAAANETEITIPDSQYFEIGEVKIALIPKTEEHTVGLSAYKDGSFSFIKQELENEEVLSSTTLSLVPVFRGTQVEVLPSENLILEIDFENDGTIDSTQTVAKGESAPYTIPEEPVDPIEPVDPPTESENLPAKPETDFSFLYSQVTKDIEYTGGDKNETDKTIEFTQGTNDYILHYQIQEQSKTKLKILFTKLTKNGEEVKEFEITSIHFRSDQNKKKRQNLDITVRQGKRKLTLTYDQKKNTTVVKKQVKKKVTSKQRFKGQGNLRFRVEEEKLAWEVIK